MRSVCSASRTCSAETGASSSGRVVERLDVAAAVADHHHRAEHRIDLRAEHELALTATPSTRRSPRLARRRGPSSLRLEVGEGDTDLVLVVDVEDRRGRSPTCAESRRRTPSSRRAVRARETRDRRLVGRPAQRDARPPAALRPARTPGSCASSSNRWTRPARQPRRRDRRSAPRCGASARVVRELRERRRGVGLAREHRHAGSARSRLRRWLRCAHRRAACSSLRCNRPPPPRRPRRRSRRRRPAARRAARRCRGRRRAPTGSSPKSSLLVSSAAVMSTGLVVGGERRQIAPPAPRPSDGPGPRASSCSSVRRVGRHHAARTRVADHGEPPAGRTPALEIQLGGAHQFVHVLRAPDAVLPEERVDDAVLVGQRAGVRPRRRLAANRATGLDRDDRHVTLARDGRRLREHRRVADAFDVEQQQAHGRDPATTASASSGKADVRVVAGGVRVADADAAPPQQPERARRSSCRSG